MIEVNTPDKCIPRPPHKRQHRAKRQCSDKGGVQNVRHVLRFPPPVQNVNMEDEHCIELLHIFDGLFDGNTHRGETPDTRE